LGLRLGDPHDETLGAWLAKESVRDVYLTDDLTDATALLDKAIAGCQNDEVDEILSLDDTLARWRTEILNHHRTGAFNGPTEGLNLCVKKVKRAGRGFKCFEHYPLRVLLHAGGVYLAETSITAEDPEPLSPTPTRSRFTVELLPGNRELISYGSRPARRQLAVNRHGASPLWRSPSYNP
jgi:hypothetical protein